MAARWPVAARIGRAMLERLGYAVHVASDAHVASEALRGPATETSVALIDASLPAGESNEVLASLCRENPAARIVIISHRSEVEILETLGKDAPGTFLQKPFTFAELRALLE